MSQLSNGNRMQRPSEGCTGDETVVAQLEKLLDRFEELDAPTLAALDQAFERYKAEKKKKLQSPNKLKNIASSFVGGANGFITSMGKKSVAEEKKAEQYGWNKETSFPDKKMLSDSQSGKTAQAASSGEYARRILEEHARKLCASCKDAETSLAEAKTLYEYQRRVLLVYEETVVPFLDPFKKVMENLVYFAACADPAVYEEGKTPLRNKTRALRNGMNAGMWGEFLDEAHMGRIGEMFAEILPDVEFNFCPEAGSADEKTRITAYQSRIKAAQEQRKPYDLENEKLSNQIKHAQLLWEYVYLLQQFLPLLEQIVHTPEEAECAEWATEIGTAVLNVVTQHTCRNPKMKFQWIYPQGDISCKNEKIRVQFIAAELDCPGLYYALQGESDSQERFRCVCPGYAKE